MLSLASSWDAAARHRGGFGPRVSRDGGRAVVWLEGEHDLATVAVLANTLAKVVSAGGDVIVDLSGVTFLSTATIDELVQVRNLLWSQDRSFTLRSPSKFARRLLDLCGLDIDLEDRLARSDG